MNYQGAKGSWNAVVLSLLLLTLGAQGCVRGKTKTAVPPSQPASAGNSCPSCCAMPVSERTQEEGCYVLANDALDSLPSGPLYWHLYAYPNLAAASQAKK